jgi:hypothetical protein
VIAAVGKTVPAQLWSVISALSGALVGILVPSHARPAPQPPAAPPGPREHRRWWSRVDARFVSLAVAALAAGGAYFFYDGAGNNCTSGAAVTRASVVTNIKRDGSGRPTTIDVVVTGEPVSSSYRESNRSGSSQARQSAAGWGPEHRPRWRPEPPYARPVSGSSNKQASLDATAQTTVPAAAATAPACSGSQAGAALLALALAAVAAALGIMVPSPFDPEAVDIPGAVAGDKPEGVLADQ